MATQETGVGFGSRPIPLKARPSLLRDCSWLVGEALVRMRVVSSTVSRVQSEDGRIFQFPISLGRIKKSLETTMKTREQIRQFQSPSRTGRRNMALEKSALRLLNFKFSLNRSSVERLVVVVTRLIVVSPSVWQS